MIYLVVSDIFAIFSATLKQKYYEDNNNRKRQVRQEWCPGRNICKHGGWRMAWTNKVLHEGCLYPALSWRIRQHDQSRPLGAYKSHSKSMCGVKPQEKLYGWWRLPVTIYYEWGGNSPECEDSYKWVALIMVSSLCVYVFYVIFALLCVHKWKNRHFLKKNKFFLCVINNN